MLKKRIIPTILWEGISSVKGERFNTWRKLGPVLPAINIYIARNVDEIIILNISPNKYNDAIDYYAIKKFFEGCNIPLTYGGGLKNMHQIDNLLAVGVDKISICTSAYENEAFIKKISLNYGKQFVVGSVDYKFNGKAISCYSNNGLVDKNISPIEHCLKLQDMGVGEILLSSIDHEGLMGGYDLSIIKEIRDKIEIPIILSGGAGKAEHFYDGIIAGADALAASSAFLFTELTPKKVKEFLNKLMVDIRI